MLGFPTHHQSTSEKMYDSGNLENQKRGSRFGSATSRKPGREFNAESDFLPIQNGLISYPMDPIFGLAVH